LNWRAYKQIQDATTTPLAMGESCFRLEGFKDFVDNRAISVVHPDPQNCGGLHEMKRIADYANDTQGIPTATHMTGSPVMAFAAAHSLATIDNFLAVECHAVDFLPLWMQLVTGVSQPVMDKGYITVPDAPGIGLELNEPVLKEHLRTPGWFESIA
jgi:L-alanine-DL-glutamate epimerase-like enolase superfamily enzyme